MATNATTVDAPSEPGGWFNSLGKPVPAEQRRATLDLLVEFGRDAGEASMVLSVVAREMEHDQPARAQQYMRSFVGSDETLVMRALATMCAY